MTGNSLAEIFHNLFDEKLKKQIPQHKAYEEAEQEFEKEFRHRKYSSFDSYRRCRSKFIKSGKQKRK
jgi:hypothetical protein